MLNDMTIVKIKKAWDEITYKNYEGYNIKRAILLNWLKSYIRSKTDKWYYNRLRKKVKMAPSSLYSSYSGDVAKAAEYAYAYMYGIFYRKDLYKMKENLEIASQEPGFYDCQYDLAKCYLNGWGTEKDIEQAKYWFNKAAENGHPKAREQLDLINKG